jgi:hypothetical protein
MTNFNFYDYDSSDISEAIDAVTGDDVQQLCLDDEHLYWYIVQDGGVDDNDAGAETIDDLYDTEVVEKIQAYLEANYEAS